MTVRQVAARIGVSTALPYRLCEIKELQSIRIGGTFRFQEAALHSFLAALDLAAKR
jgi:excisionase family DNA binding protein